MATYFSNSTPAAPTGGVNVTWQSDVSGNLSAYTGVGPVKQTVAPVTGVLTVDASLGSSVLVTVNAAITSMSIINPTDGQEITFLWQQDATGHAITLATNLLGATAPSTGANLVSCQKFTYNVGDSNWYAIAAGLTGM